MPRLRRQRRQQQPSPHQRDAELHDSARTEAIHHPADQGTRDTGSQKAEREGTRRYTALPSELVDDGWKEQRKRRAGVDADRHGDERHGDDDPAVKKGKPHWVTYLVILRWPIAHPRSGPWDHQGMTGSRFLSAEVLKMSRNG